MAIRAEEELVRSMYSSFAALARGADVETYVRTFYDPKVVYEPLEESDPIRGHDEMIRWNARWFDVWQELDVGVEELRAFGERLMTKVKVEARGNESGLEVSQTFFHVFDFRDGRIFRMYEFERADAALALARTT